MKTSIPALVTTLVASALVAFAQDSSPPPAPVPEDAPPPLEVPPELAQSHTIPEPETPPPAPTPAPAPAPAPTPPIPVPTPPPAPVPAPALAPAAAPAPIPAAAPLLAQTSAPPKPETAPPPSAPHMESGAPGAGELIPLIQIEDVPLTEAIRNLARQANVSFLFDPRVSATNQPNISIRLENVTAVEALTALLDNHTLVLVKDPRTRIARITIRDPKAEDPLISQIVQLRYADPTNIISLVKATLSPRSQVIADPRTSQVLVTTTEKEMNAATNLIERLDLPTKQVLIEAKLYETARNPQSLKGVDWSGTLENQRVILGNNAVGGTPASEPIPGIGGTPTTPASGGTVGGILSDPKLLMNASAGSFFNPAMAFLNADGVSAVVSFLNKDSDSEIVATPRAVTLDNQSAKLEVSRAFPIFKITPGSANSPAGAEITYTNLGVILNVTPRIAADKNISLRVVPEVSSIDGKDEQVINGVKNVANIYAIRRVETHVMIPSSHTLVMGGLISDTKSKGYTKVPIAGDIPVFGFAFRSESKRRNRSNLLMFITPTIVENEAFQSNEVGREFLQTKYFDPPDRKETAWDSAKPHDWTKPRK